MSGGQGTAPVCAYCGAATNGRMYCDKRCAWAAAGERRAEALAAANAAKRAAAQPICEDCKAPIEVKRRGYLPKHCPACTRKREAAKMAARRAAKTRLRGFVRYCQHEGCKAVATSDDPSSRRRYCDEHRLTHRLAYDNAWKTKKRRLTVLTTLTEEVGGRPQMRGDCEAGPRPCPWSACRYHLGLDVVASGYGGATPRLLVNQKVRESCALDVAARGSHTMEEVAEILGVTRQAVEHVERRALERAGGAPVARELLDEREITRGIELEPDNDENTRGLTDPWASAAREELAGIRRTA